jgi:SOS-response transcriptional repressor LexA
MRHVQPEVTRTVKRDHQNFSLRVKKRTFVQQPFFEGDLILLYPDRAQARPDNIIVRNRIPSVRHSIQVIQKATKNPINQP